MDKHEEIAKRIATEIFYLPATNGKAEASIQHGTELILKAMQECADGMFTQRELESALAWKSQFPISTPNEIIEIIKRGKVKTT